MGSTTTPNATIKSTKAELLRPFTNENGQLYAPIDARTAGTSYWMLYDVRNPHDHTQTIDQLLQVHEIKRTKQGIHLKSTALFAGPYDYSCPPALLGNYLYRIACIFCEINPTRLLVDGDVNAISEAIEELSFLDSWKDRYELRWLKGWLNHYAKCKFALEIHPKGTRVTMQSPVYQQGKCIGDQVEAEVLDNGNAPGELLVWLPSQKRRTRLAANWWFIPKVAYECGGKEE